MRVKNDLNRTSVRGQTYTEWELHQACVRRILVKPRYSDILVKFGVPNSTLTYFLKVIVPPLKISSLKYMWDIVGVGKIRKRIGIEVI